MTSQHDCMLKYVHIMSFERNKAKKKKWDSVLDYLPNALIKFVRFFFFLLRLSPRSEFKSVFNSDFILKHNIQSRCIDVWMDTRAAETAVIKPQAHVIR